MKKTVLAFLILAYIILINLISCINFYEIEHKSKKEINSRGEIVKVNFKDDVSVTVKKDRWYGRIIENDGLSNLYLFYFIRLPLKRGNFNYLYAHILFSIIIILMAMKNYLE